MKDPRFYKLADMLVNYSTRVQPGEAVAIRVSEATPECFISALAESIQKAGGWPYPIISNSAVGRKIKLGATEDYVKKLAEMDSYILDQASAIISVRAQMNDSEESDVPGSQQKLYRDHYTDPVIRDVVLKKKWVALKWPTPAMAQKAGMSTEAFEDFYFDICANVDYPQMSKNMDPLVDLLEKTDIVWVNGPGDTNLTFSIKGIGTEKCAGELNVPDGEVFTAPVVDSVNGIIHYNTPTIYEGKKFAGIRLEFKKGKIIDASCEAGNQSDLIAILDTDAGARFVGEFAIGVNPLIKTPMCDILFDEKIAESIHFTPGMAYEGTPPDNGNRSKIHWDLVLIQSKEMGGGEIRFDNQLVRKNGLFIPAELQALNP